MSNADKNPGKRGIPPSRPTPDQLKEFRTRLGLTPSEAAARIHTKQSTWEKHELPKEHPDFKPIPVAAWELFNLIAMFSEGMTFGPEMDAYLLTRYHNFNMRNT